MALLSGCEQWGVGAECLLECGGALHGCEWCQVRLSIAIVHRNEGEDDLPVQQLTLLQFRANVM
jgi:hypothetical protein